MVEINIKQIDGWVLNPNPRELNNKIKEIGEKGGCNEISEHLVVCPCQMYLKGKGCTKKLYVRDSNSSFSLLDPPE